MVQQEPGNKTIVMTNRIGEGLAHAVITDIQWERIIMHLTVHVDTSSDYDNSVPLSFFIVTGYNKANGMFKTEQTAPDTYILSMNVTNPGYCMCLPTGTYSILACQGDDILSSTEISGDICSSLSDKSRTFLHNNKTKGYVVNFSVSETEESLSAVITIADMSRTGLPVLNEETRPEMLQGSRRKKTFLRNLNGKRHSVLTNMYHFLSAWHRMFSKKDGKKTILFASEQSETLGTNLTSVMDRMKERGLDADYNILTSARATVANPHSGIKSWTRFINKVSKADIIFIDDHCPVFDWFILDRNNTELVQLWHAGAGFKSSGYSRWGHTGCPAPFSCHRQYSYGIAGSRNIAHFFSEVFGINTEQVLPTGMPRMDEYLDPEFRKKTTADLYKKYPIAKGKKVILFAPTYRGKNRADAHYPYELIDFDRLYTYCQNEDCVVFFKMHPWVPTAVPIKEEYKDRFVDVNKYPNINNLFYITNLLITDYSSNIFEYSLMRQPALFFAFDEIQYAFSRGFHRDYESSAPGRICHTFDDVMDALERKDFEFEKIEQYVINQFDHIDSNASDRVIDWILLGKMPEDIVAANARNDAITQRLRDMDFSSMEAVEESESDEDTESSDSDDDNNA